MARDSASSNDPCRSCVAPPTARRAFLRGALGAGIGFGLVRPLRAEDDKPGSDEKPQPGDLFVFAEGDKGGRTIIPSDLTLNASPVMAWPTDARTKTVRDGSRLNQVLLLRLDPRSLDEEMQPHTAAGIVAFSAICTHAGCPVTGWIQDEGRQVLKCFCHNSEYDPRQQAKVVFGPAPRHLAVLPVKIVDGTLAVAQGFIGRVGPSLSG